MLLLTIENTAELNAMTEAMQAELGEKLAQAAADDAVRGVLITGAGQRAFCAGGSMSSLLAITDERGIEGLYRRGTRITDTIRGMEKPVVAAVNGWCIGAGFETAMACDYVCAADTAGFALTEINMGFIPDWGALAHLRQNTHPAVRDMLLLGKKLHAQQAFEAGIVHRLCSPQQLMQQARDVLAELAAKPPLAYAAMKRVLNNDMLRQQRACIHELNAGLMQSQDYHEAVAAFTEKRKPVFMGR